MSRTLLPAINLNSKIKVLFYGSVIFCCLYLGVGINTLVNANLCFTSDLDLIIPLLPWTIVIYFSHYILVFCGYWFSINHKTATHTFYSYLLATFIAVIVFITYPTYLPHQDLNSADFNNITRTLYKILYLIDVPTNCLPSLHTCLALLAANSLKANLKWQKISNIWAGAVIISTLTTKQHVIIDVISGIILYYIIVYLIFYAQKTNKN